jgi:hypothetical protein
MRQAGELTEIKITETDIERGAELLQRWVGSERGPVSDVIAREFVAEVLETVGHRSGLKLPPSSLEHDRSLYRAPEL